MATLPVCSIPTFSGNPLDYKLFMRAFEHEVMSKTDSFADRLYYLEQYTAGEAKDILRSCVHMKPVEEYNQALALLKHHFGDEYRITTSYVEKALKWDTIQNEDEKALKAYALFLATVMNTLSTEDSMGLNELDHPKNLKELSTKLPLRMRAAWRKRAVDIQDVPGQRARFADFVKYVDKEARIATDPVFGNIVSAKSDKHAEARKSNTSTAKQRPKGSFVTNVSDTSSGSQDQSCTNEPFSCKLCSGAHPTVLHRNPESGTGQNTGNSAQTTDVRNGCTGVNQDCAIAIIPVKVKAGSKVLLTYAFLDNGSSASFMTERLMSELGASGREINLRVSTMTDKSKAVVSHEVKGLEISGLNGDYIPLPVLYTQTTLPITREDIPRPKDINRWPHLRHVPVTEVDTDIGLLIGSNVPKALEPWDIIKSEGNGLYAVKTVLGWTINRPLNETSNKGTVSINRVSIDQVPLEEQLKKFYETDFRERTIDDKPEFSAQDKKFMAMAEASVTLQDNSKYELGLPLKDGTIMPNNKRQAEQRLAMLKKRFQRDETYHEEYSLFMGNVLEKGYARAVPENELGRKDGKERVAVMADIESMFMRVNFPDNDASLLRFLWWKDGDVNNDVLEYQMKVHLFGATSSPSCANFALHQTAKDNAHSYDAVVTQALMRSFYVDDYLDSRGSADIAIPMVADVRELCAKGGFRLTKWISNDREVLKSIPEEELAKGVKDLDFDQDVHPSERALGVKWCPDSDTFGFKNAR
ncbi:uncharacterized protein LOC135498680 [Lineus longissimus]|uniref:uncharacterized protein LOC135498680 n=1 Tax=Lineus longissimus TaxID=88925 RepID=UPI00315CEFFD